MTSRVRAPELPAGPWLNTGEAGLRLTDLRGKVVLLDFWTFCCVNCLHVLDELRPLEAKYGDALVVIGVHSPKFAHERDHEALTAAVERYGVAHPVLNDADLTVWDAYAARAWPTLVLIDPDGYVVATMAGEGHADSLDRIVGDLVDRHARAGTLDTGPGPYTPPPVPETTLRFPGKAVPTPGGGLLVADSAHHRIAHLAADGETLIRTYGAGERGHRDGGPGEAAFNEPQGLCVLPAEVASRVGYDVVVADTVNHRLRGLRLSDGHVTTVAGSGDPWRSQVDDEAHDALTTDLSSPWDVAWYDGRVVVAMAGIHQLWWFDPIGARTGVYAGTTVESLRDGPIPDVWLAQPSGLAVDGDRLWFVDAETSALRRVEAGVMHTAVGQGLFDFGHVDGPAGDALLQHPLGVAVLPDGRIGIADTYNGAVRCYDPAENTVSTLATGLAEPSGLTVDGDRVWVVESAAHRLTPLRGTETVVGGHAQQVVRSATPLAPGALVLEVVFTPPPGRKLDDSFGPPTRLTVTSDPPELLAEGAGEGTDLTRRLRVADGVPSGVLQVVAQAASCDIDVPNPACHLTRQDWGVPVTVTRDGEDRLTLMLHGHDG
ncbi:thiol-disulfide isomerase/thioredoxin [Stackebrandtia albiflava]|uniref:Thiol-disulfide isomerase/thioredoxin n=1 Tax=Stackebrandtia albiflava TaxID=406432 RepID=A0A562UYU1_9ACTN|nr:NHL domain-containing thioredoxin family protein [Stackebrandtia albiflava]TWJ10767.1 thiol-disulfide isomerase/thioredoxin [Stackebrandtia albiflava]